MAGKFTWKNPHVIINYDDTTEEDVEFLGDFTALALAAVLNDRIETVAKNKRPTSFVLTCALTEY